MVNDPTDSNYYQRLASGQHAVFQNLIAYASKQDPRRQFWWTDDVIAEVAAGQKQLFDEVMYFRINEWIVDGERESMLDWVNDEGSSWAHMRFTIWTELRGPDVGYGSA